ncbi:MAG: hypothetical protein U0Y82_16305 [Thermoleophilia bacterium]
MRVRDEPRREGARADAIAARAAAAGDWPAAVTALRARGWAEREVFDYAAARATLNRAIAVARRRGLTDLRAGVHATRASVWLEVGNARRARADIALARAALDGRSTPEIDLQEAVIEDASGHLILAAGLYRRMLEADRPPPAAETRFTVHNNLGVVLMQLGELEEARLQLTHAARHAADLGRSTEGS